MSKKSVNEVTLIGHLEADPCAGDVGPRRVVRSKKV